MSVPVQDVQAIDTDRLIQLERDASLPAERRRDIVAELARRSPARAPQPSAPLAGLCCPRCTSPDVRSFSILHAEGVTTIDATLSAGTLGASQHGGLGVAGTKGNLRGVTRTTLSQMVAPPTERADTAPFFAMVLCWFVVAFAMGATDLFPTAAVFLVASTIAILVWWFMPRPGASWNRSELPRLRSEWQRKFMCRRCGDAFMIRQ